jgi:kynureninase
MTEFESLRGLFPQLRDRIYLAAHSFGPPPIAVLEDLDAYRETLLQRPRLFHEWIERLEEMYGLVERLVGAPPASVALRESASAAHLSVLAALDSSERRRILVSELHFPSIRYMASAQSARGFHVEVVPSADGIHLDADAIVARLDDDVAAVLAPIVAPFNGAKLDMHRLVEAADEVGALAVLDGYAALGVVAIDVARLPPCVLIGGTMKWLGGGGTGLAFMYVHAELIERLPVAYPGWIGHAAFMDFSGDYRPAPGARRFQLGTPAIEPVYTARAGLRFVLEQGAETLALRNRELLEIIVRQARTWDLAIRTPMDPERRAGVIALEVPDPTAVVLALRAVGIEVDARAGVVRLGPHWCVSAEECDRSIDALAHTLGR